jgi:hypothetical protein
VFYRSDCPQCPDYETLTNHFYPFTRDSGSQDLDLEEPQELSRLLAVSCFPLVFEISSPDYNENAHVSDSLFWVDRAR